MLDLHERLIWAYPSAQDALNHVQDASQHRRSRLHVPSPELCILRQLLVGFGRNMHCCALGLLLLQRKRVQGEISDLRHFSAYPGM